MCREHDIARYVPDPPEGLIGFDEAVRLALVRIRDADVATHWSNASVAGVPSDPMPTDPDWAQGTLYVDERSRRVDAPADVLWSVIEGIGGDVRAGTRGRRRGRCAGSIDRLSGGPGLRRGRRSPHDLQLGDAVDFWRVEEIVDGELLRLRAEMQLPGRAWLDLGIEHDDAGRHAVPPARRVRAEGPVGARLLVGRVAVPRLRVRRHAAQHRRPRRATSSERRARRVDAVGSPTAMNRSSNTATTIDCRRGRHGVPVVGARPWDSVPPDVRVVLSASTLVRLGIGYSSALRTHPGRSEKSRRGGANTSTSQC